MPDLILEEAQRVNQQPLNREARKWLEQAIKPDRPDERKPYSLQLAWWALDRNLPVQEQGHPGIREALPTLLLRLDKLTPQQQMAYLETGDPEPEEELDMAIQAWQLQEAEDSEEAAQLILETLVSHLIANQEDLP